jgi:glutamate 5-kinase
LKNRICIKVGSNVLTKDDGLPDEDMIRSLTEQISRLKSGGWQVIVVSSGAVASGRSVFKTTKKLDTVVQRQLLSSVGQVKLMNLYTTFFRETGLLCAQVLVTKQDFKDREHYLNMQNCLSALLINNIIPIVNENDVISITELMFTDNDELAGLISLMMDVEQLYILTNVDGIYDGNPSDASARVISEFDESKHSIRHIATVRSSFGRGGIITKCHTAQRVARLGIPVTIANGKTSDIINRLVTNENLGTKFKPRKSTSGVKKWIASSQSHSKGKVIINEGAKKIITSAGVASLLPVGVVRVDGEFIAGEVISIFDEAGVEIGLGRSMYSSKKAHLVIGQKNQKPIIHYDHLYIHSDKT